MATKYEGEISHKHTLTLKVKRAFERGTYCMSYLYGVPIASASMKEDRRGT